MVTKKGDQYYVVFESIEYNAGPYTKDKAWSEHRKAIQSFGKSLKLSDLPKKARRLHSQK